MLRVTSVAIQGESCVLRVTKAMNLMRGEERDADAKTGKGGRLGLRRTEVERVLKEGGLLSVSDILLCKIRYLTHGTAIGCGDFLQIVMEENRQRFSPNRTRAGRAMKGADWGELQVLRGLQSDVFG